MNDNSDTEIPFVTLQSENSSDWRDQTELTLDDRRASVASLDAPVRNSGIDPGGRPGTVDY